MTWCTADRPRTRVPWTEGLSTLPSRAKPSLGGQKQSLAATTVWPTHIPPSIAPMPRLRLPTRLAVPFLQHRLLSYVSCTTPQVDRVAASPSATLLIDASILTQRPSAGQTAERIRSGSVRSPHPPAGLSHWCHPRWTDWKGAVSWIIISCIHYDCNGAPHEGIVMRLIA